MISLVWAFLILGFVNFQALLRALSISSLSTSFRMLIIACRSVSQSFVKFGLCRDNYSHHSLPYKLNSSLVYLLFPRHCVIGKKILPIVYIHFFNHKCVVERKRYDEKGTWVKEKKVHCCIDLDLPGEIRAMTRPNATELIETTAGPKSHMNLSLPADNGNRNYQKNWK